ncbi:MAG: hypothetical protein ABIG67_00150 [Pseudomonadota bacterium]
MGRFVKSLSYDNPPKAVIEKGKCCMINGMAIGMSCHRGEVGWAEGKTVYKGSKWCIFKPLLKRPS